MGMTIDEITVADEPESWRAAGFTVDDAGECRVGHVRIRLVGRTAGKRIIGWSLIGLDLPGDDLDGLPTGCSDRDPAEPAEHPNGALVIDHLVVATPDLERTTAALESVGLPARRTRDSDTYGAQMRQRFFRLGEVILEVIGAPDASGDGSAVFFGLAHTVADLDAAKALLGDALGTPKPAVQPGRRIVTLRHKQVGMSVATAFMSQGEQEYS
jgi:Glyoxalase-like domain